MRTQPILLADIHAAAAAIVLVLAAGPVFGSPFVYIGNSDGTVSVIDAATNTVTSTLHSVGNLAGMAAAPDGTRIYAANQSASSISIISTATGKSIGNVPMGSSVPFAVAVSPDGSRVYAITENTADVSVIDTATSTVTATVHIGSSNTSLFGVAVSPDGARVYVSTVASQDGVAVINAATNSVVATVPVGTAPLFHAYPYGLAVTPNGSRVYVAGRDDNRVAVIDTATNTVIASIAVGSSPIGVAVAPDGSRVYVASASADTVSVISTATNTVVATAVAGATPTGVAVTPDGSRAYVPNFNGNNVSIISTATNSVVATVPVGPHPTTFGTFIAAPPFEVAAPVTISGGIIGDQRVSVTAVATFPPEYIGKHIYLFAYAPSALVKAQKDGPCVLAAITPTGLQAVSSSNSLNFTQNVVSANQQSISLLNNVPATQVAGASLCIGVGNTGQAATTAGNYVCPATVSSTSTVCQPPPTISLPNSFGGGGIVAKTLGSRATVSSAATLFGGFELSGAATVYILVRGNSLGTLGITQNYLDAPRVRLYNAQGQDMIADGNVPGFNGCSSGAFSGAAVVSYYTNVRGAPAHPRDGCTAQNLAAGAYTFTVTPSTAGTTSLPSSGQVLFEVTLGAGSGTITKTLGSRATVTSTATLYGGFEIGTTSNVYILVRGNSLGTLGVTQAYLDAPRVRLFDNAGQDLVISSSGSNGTGFNGCDASSAVQSPVVNYYQNVRGAPAAGRDACIARLLSPGAYTFSVTPSIPGVTSSTELSAPSSGQVLFEVTLQ